MQQRLDVINKEIERIAPIKALADKTKLPAGVFVAGPILVLVIAVVLGIGASFFTTLIGVAYPTFKSIIALESPSTDDDKQWLTYWSIFGFLVVVDEFGAFSLSYIPYYYFIKVCFLIWLFNPATQGATVLYSNVVQPVMKKYGKQIEEFIALVSEVTDLSKLKQSPKEESKTE